MLTILLLVAACPAIAQIDQPKEVKTWQQFGSYTVHYTVFNSKQIPPQVADVYKITRSKDIIYINISLTKTENGATSLGLPAEVKAKATNLMQQSKNIQFREIKEPEATYYLASFRHTNEEDIRFDVSVLPNGESKPLTLSFSRRLYIEE
ncbi:MAG TPA: DUF4426 domain-containing protein [Cellvibrio sp.]|nr:DUF4426 domain-containing protein [Cellvibrio sp.]